jgi:hypothetical protein
LVLRHRFESFAFTQIECPDGAHNLRILPRDAGSDKQSLEGGLGRFLVGTLKGKTWRLGEEGTLRL